MQKPADKLFSNRDRYAVVRRVFSENFWQYRYRYLLAAILMVITSAATGGTAYLMGQVTNTLLNSRVLEPIIWTAFLVMGVFVLRGAATYGHMVVLQRIGNGLVATVQKRVYAHLVRLKPLYFDNVTIGDILVRTTQGAIATRLIIETIVISVCRDVLTLFFLVVVMFLQDPIMALVMLTIGPLAGSFIRNVVKRTTGHAERQLESMAATSSIIKETVSGIMLVKTYTLENEMEARMSKAVEDVRLRADKIARLTARTAPIMETLGGVAVGLAVVYAGWRSTSGDYAMIVSSYPGQMMSFFTAFLLAYQPAKRLARFRVTMEPQIVAMERMYGLIDDNEPELLAGEAGPIAVQCGAVRFNHIDFNYRDDMPVLHDVSFSVEPGQRVALVGHSGSGKSTIFKLLLGLYRPSSGTIEIDGHNITNHDPRSVRDAIAYVGQEAHIFTGSVHENIAFGNPDADQAAIEKAARAALAHEFIVKMPGGYAAFVGEAGAQLSGGQRQRIAIARAFLKDAPIILLDEATSALDTRSEKMVQAALEDLLKGRTTFAIAHRLSTVQNCDAIFVLREGRIIEAGDHETLMARSGTYQQLHKLQFADAAQ